MWRNFNQFGVDAPGYAIYALLVAPIATIGSIFGLFHSAGLTSWQISLYIASTLMCFSWLLSILIFWRTSLLGKYEIWQQLLSDHSGISTALDIGTGRGAVVKELITRTSAKTITGIDIWTKKDQLNNSIAAWKNNIATLPTTSDQLITATYQDITDKHYDGQKYDLITASMVLHNIHDRDALERAFQNISTSTKPGGRLIIVDMGRKNAKIFSQLLADNNLKIVKTKNWGIKYSWGIGSPNSFDTFSIEATK